MLLTLLPSDLFGESTTPYLIRYIVIIGLLFLLMLAILFFVIMYYRRTLGYIQSIALTDPLTGGHNVIVGIKAPRQTDSRRLSRPLTIHTVHGAHYQNHRIACLFYMTFSGFLLYSFEITFKAILPFLPLITKGLFLQKLVAPHPQQKNRYRAHSRCQAPIEILI